MPRRVQGTGIGEEGEDFTTSAEIVVLAALTPCSSLEPCAFPASTLSFDWAKLGLLDQRFWKSGPQMHVSDVHPHT